MNLPHTAPEQSTGVHAGISQPHVLVLTPFYPSVGDESGGCFIAESVRSLESQGIRVSVYAAIPLYRPRKMPSPFASAKWVRYPQVPGNVGLSSAGRWLYARLRPEISTIHRRTPIDVIHAHAALPCGHAAALLSRHLGIPFVVTLHGLDVFNTCFLEGRPAQWRRHVSQEVYKAARTVICISDKIRLLVQQGVPQNVNCEVVYNGTDTNIFSPGVSAAPPSSEILSVGNLIAIKGHEQVLRAVQQLQAFVPQVQCTIIGEGPDRERLDALARDLGISARVRFLGRQSRAEVADAMRRCSIFALPSRYEGLGCVYLEAMASGKPVVACRGQGIDEIIEHGKNGWLIPVDGFEQLTQGLATLLRSEELRVTLGREARLTILNGLTLADQARRLAQIYRSAIA